MRDARSPGRRRRFLRPALAAAGALLAGMSGALLATCGPFTDAAGDAFCPFVLEIFYLGITTGTTATTYDPASNVSRLQMAAFLSRTVDGALKRGSRRAALDQFWTPKNAAVLGLTTVGTQPLSVACDGTDVWVVNAGSDSVSRVRASDGKLLETWTGVPAPFNVLAAMGRVFVTNVHSLYRIDPSQPAGAVTTLASNLPNNVDGIAFDGARIWTANLGDPPSVSIITPGATIPWTVTTVTAGFSQPFAALFDGANVWITDKSAARLRKLDSAGAILQSVTAGAGGELRFPVFDGANIWVPSSTTVTVVRASSGAILATLTGNGLNAPNGSAFDGERILITNQAGSSVSLWKAADLTPLGSVSTGPDTGPYGACSDGSQFWITLIGTGKLARF
jgi:hypothetical protein